MWGRGGEEQKKLEENDERKRERERFAFYLTLLKHTKYTKKPCS
jgi:hypothetical protein